MADANQSQNNCRMIMQRKCMTGPDDQKHLNKKINVKIICNQKEKLIFAILVTWPWKAYLSLRFCKRLKKENCSWHQINKWIFAPCKK